MRGRRARTRRTRQRRAVAGPTRLALTAVYEPDTGGWVRGHLVELPGVITAAPNLKEARSSIRDALTEYLAASETVAQGPGVEVEELVLEIVPDEATGR